MRTRSAKALGAIAMLSAAAMLFAGCAAGNTAPSESNSPSAALPTVDWDAADAGDVQDGGTLNLAVGALPVNYNNSQIDGNDVDTNTLLSSTSGGPLRITRTSCLAPGAICSSGGLMVSAEVAAR